MYIYLQTEKKLFKFLFLWNLDPATLGDNAEMQKVEPEPIKPAAEDSSVLHDFATGSMELTKQTEKTER